MGNTSMFNWIFSVKLIIVIIASFWTLLSAQPSLGENTSQSSSQMLFKRRMRRATDCTMGFISGEMTSNSLRLASYSASQLDACLNNNVLLANLTQLGQIAFSRDQLLVLKEKLGEYEDRLASMRPQNYLPTKGTEWLLSAECRKMKISSAAQFSWELGHTFCLPMENVFGKMNFIPIYTGGLPEERIRQLGFIITVYGPEEISMWNITNADTLALVLNNSPNLNTSKAIISNYLQRSGPLDAVALDAIGGPLLCTLSEENLRTILPSELKKAKPLNISMCTQAKKDILFGIAKVAFQDLAGDPKAYFNQLKPYIGGARASDLQRLAPGNISMDFQTFSSLNPVEVEKLTVQNIRDLLGINLNSLKENEDHEIVRRWVNSHTVDEVTSLGIGLRGGISPAGLGNFSFQELPGSASVNSYNLLLSICITVMGITLQHLS